MTSALLISTACGLTAAVSWGSADFFAARASKSDSPERAAVFVSLIGALVFSLLYIPFLQNTTPWTLSGVLYALTAGVFIGAGLLMFYRALEIGPISLVSPVGSAYPLVTTILVLTFLGGNLSSVQLGGILLIVVGIIAASGLFESKKSERRLSIGLMYSLATFVLWGIGFAVLGEAVARMGWQKTTLVDIWLEFLVILAIVTGSGKVKLAKTDARLMKDKFIIAVALVQLFGLVVFNFGLTKSDSTAVLTAISATYPALTVFLAIKHLGEKTPIIPLAGAFVTILGVVVLSIN